MRIFTLTKLHRPTTTIMVAKTLKTTAAKVDICIGILWIYLGYGA
jgi:hypothetical protein